jgi:hypothetical protein
MRDDMQKKAQIQLTFHWIYILIAGAVILLFFVGIILNQKEASEKNLRTDVVQIMDSIFTSSLVSEKTKNSVSTEGLSDYTLSFSCDNDVSEFGIVGGGGAVQQNNIDSIFSPLKLKANKLTLWSLPYKMPFKVSDFLYVTSPSVKYYIYGNDDFALEFLDATKESKEDGFRINREHIDDFSKIEPGNLFHVRMVDLTGNLKSGDEIPENLKNMADESVSAVVFKGRNQVNFLIKKNDVWQKMNRKIIPIISLGGEKDAARFAAIFSGDDKIYQCNMQKAFNRLQHLISLHQKKLDKMVDFYMVHHPELRSSKSVCIGFLLENQKNMNDLMSVYSNQAKSCKYQSGCDILFSTAEDIQNTNTLLREECIKLY